MIAAEATLIRLLDEFATNENVLSGQRPLPRDLDFIGFAILHLISEYENDLVDRSAVRELVQLCLDRIDGSGLEGEAARKASHLPFLWGDAEKYSFTLARSLLDGRLSGDDTNVNYSFLSTSDSGVRSHCIRAMWFCRAKANTKLAVKFLLGNIADKLGYVNHSAALARAMLPSDDHFYTACASFEPPEDFKEQFEERVKAIESEESLPEFSKLFSNIELEVRRKIEQTALKMEVQVRVPSAVQMELCT